MNRTKLTALLMAGVCSLSLALAGCSGQEAAPADDAATGTTEASEPAKEPVEALDISLACTPTSGQVFQYLAADRGYLEEEGINVELIHIGNNPDAFTSLAAGKVDVLSTYGTGGPLTQIANGQPFTIFGGYMITGETPCFGLPETEWNGLESFRGKSIATTRFGTADIVLRSVLYQAGIYDEVTFVEMKTSQDVLQAVANGEVDFGGTATGFELQAAKLGLEIKMWPDDYYPNHSCCRMLCSDEFIADEANQEKLYRLLRAYLRAESDMQDEAVKAEVVDLVVENLDLDKATVESFVHSPHMKYNTDPNKHAVQKVWQNMEGFGYLTDTNVKLEDHINTSVYEKALTSLMEDYPDNQFFKDKMEQFKRDNTGDYDPANDPNKIVTDLTVNLMEEKAA